MHHRKWKLTLALKSPVVMNSLTPLDGTLAGILYGGRHVEDPALDMLVHLPLKPEAAPMASLPIFTRNGCPPITGTLRFKPSLGRAVINDRALTRTIHPSGDVMRRGGDASANRSYQRGSVNRIIEADAVTYYLTGDLDAVIEVLRFGGAIGAQRTKGFGGFADGTFDPPMAEEIHSDLPIGIVDAEGAIVRPMPDSWRGTANDPGILRHGRYAIPYRDSEARALGRASSAIRWPTSIPV